MSGWKIILAFGLGFIFAQTIKFALEIITGGKKNILKDFKSIFRCFTKSGGMPSGHAASLTAVTTYIGLAAGINSGLFALALCFTAIVLYDAVNVRYAVGEQGKELNKIIKNPLQIVEGHTFVQMIMGVSLGVVIGALTYIFL